MLHELWNRLESRLRHRDLDDEMDDEMRFHVEMQTEKNVAAGMMPQEARRVALRDFGGATQAQEACRDARHTWLDSIWQDVRYALRSFRRDRVFTVTAILTLAIGIGATTSTYSIVDGLLFRPLPYKEPDRIVMLMGRNPKTGDLWETLPQSVFTALHAARSFDGVASYDGDGPLMTTTGGQQAERIATAAVSSDFFAVLGVMPQLGRTFGPDDGSAGKVGVLTYGCWQRQYGGDRTVVGRTVTFQEGAVTIVGVLGPDFWNPRTTAEDAPALLLADPVDWTSPKARHRLMGRLRKGVSVKEAQAEVIAATTSVMRLHEGAQGQVYVTPLRSQMVWFQHDALLTVLGAVLFLLLIACVNVANLMLARGRSREHEFAVRSSLGAGRWRIARQLLTESLVLGAVGAAVGVLLSRWTLDTLLAQLPEGYRLVRDIGIDGRVLAFSSVVTLASALLFGAVPALDASRPTFASSLKLGTHGVGRSRRIPVRSTLLAAEVGLALVLLVGAGLLAGSFVRLTRLDMGFDTSNVTIVYATPPTKRYPSASQVTEFYDRGAQQIASIPGVQAVTTADISPLTSAIMKWPVRIEARPAEESLDTWRVGAPYFRTIGLRVVEGTVFPPSTEDRRAAVAVVNETMARRYWPGGSAVGRRLIVWKDTPVQIVGVVSDTRTGLRQNGVRKTIAPTIYVPYDASYRNFRHRAFVIRTRPGSANLLPAIKGRLATVDREVPLTTTTLEEYLHQAVATPRFYALVVGLFAAIGLLLAGVGIAGVAAHDVVRRTHEIGVRMALGATAARVVRLVTTRGAFPVVLGLALGMAAAYALTRVLESLLFEVRPHDPVTFAAVATGLAVVALLATYLPARRAARVDPIDVLRAE